MKSALRMIPGAIPIARAVRQTLRDRNFTPTYNEDCLITNHHLTTDARFEAAFKRAGDLGLGTDSNIKWRAHIICWAAKRGAQLGGAFVECGVNRGFMSRIVCDYLDTVPNFYLLDTYSGFDPRYLSEQQAVQIEQTIGLPRDRWNEYTGEYAECYESVVKTFSDKPQVKVVRGAVPDTLPQVTESKIAYLAIDMNCAIPEIEAIKYFWPKLAPGATVVLDDYGHSGHDEQRLAWDAWSKENGVPLMSLPTGQGLFTKLG